MNPMIKLELESMHPIDYSTMLKRLARIVASSHKVLMDDGVIVCVVVHKLMVRHSRFTRELTVSTFTDDMTFIYLIQSDIGPDSNGVDKTMPSMAYFDEYYKVLNNQGKPFSSKEEAYEECESWIEDYL